MAVPKCKECKDLNAFKIGKRTFYECYHSDVFPAGKKIYASRIKTSPNWCPKRIMQ